MIEKIVENTRVLVDLPVLDKEGNKMPLSNARTGRVIRVYGKEVEVEIETENLIRTYPLSEIIKINY